jgi:hypothetical protein
LIPLARGNAGSAQLESDLSKPVRDASASSSLGGVVPPPHWMSTGPVIQSRHVKELLEQHKNWFLQNPEEMMSAPSAKDMFNVAQYGADGQDKSKETSLERYFDNRERPKRTGNSSKWFSEDDPSGERAKPKSRDEDSSRDDFELPSSLRESEQNLRKLFDDDPKGSVRNSLTDIFGLDNDKAPKELLPGKKNFMDEYKKMYGPALYNQSPLAPIPNSVLAPAYSGGKMDMAVKLPKHEANDTASVLKPQLSGAKLPDLNAQALTQWNPLQVTPQPDPAPRRLPPVPSGIPDFPRRKF